MGKKLFDYVIGNPPYQEDIENKGDRANPVYDKFMDSAFQLADVVELIHPARFLFNAGQTSKQWNEKMLNDEHFKVLYYELDATKIFPSTDIKGGIAITIRNRNEKYGAIKVYTTYDELNSIVHRVLEKTKKGFIDTIISSRGNYRTTDIFFKDFPSAPSRLGKGTRNMIASNFFEKLPEVNEDGLMHKSKSVKFLARINSKRTICYLQKVNCKLNLNNHNQETHSLA